MSVELWERIPYTSPCGCESQWYDKWRHSAKRDDLTLRFASPAGRWHWQRRNPPWGNSRMQPCRPRCLAGLCEPRTTYQSCRLRRWNQPPKFDATECHRSKPTSQRQWNPRSYQEVNKVWIPVFYSYMWPLPPSRVWREIPIPTDQSRMEFGKLDPHHGWIFQIEPDSSSHSTNSYENYAPAPASAWCTPYPLTSLRALSI